ncbi:GATA transcription factor 5-like [Impatiens glandulifera]|uniref:GATA transcription factor 5-like n=1 Tax=Impatiens glandulifera TaxID=253017 RepID=UPI001FB0C5EA|nr:GATA transcription factor 5-like [Impatiens glandulifera]
MLYRTHHSFSFSHLLSPSSPRRLLSPPAPPPPPFALQVEMERGEGVLKHGLSRPEMGMKKPNQQPISDDFWGLNSQNGISGGDDFFVDDLLDFSKDGIIEEEKEEEAAEEKQVIEPEKPPALADQPFSRSNLTVLDHLRSVSCEEFNVPAGDLEDLEWLSHFVDDSFSGYPLTYPAGKLPDENPATDRTQSAAVEEKPCFTSPVQTKARSKRARTGGRVWSIGSGSLTESSTNSSTSSSSTYSSPNSNPCLIYVVPSHSQTAESLMGHPQTKKQRKKKPENTVVAGFAGNSIGGCGSQPVRRCSHCLVQKTPQWRAGPLGAKTLCNACGVRYKSGRLLPEYRPACSPTFSTELHSNNHRKVMEMRRKKEVDDEEEMGPPPVTSF